MKPSTRIEEIEEELKKQYAPLGNSGEYTTAQEIRINSRAIIQYIDEQAESQEPKALEEKPYICGGQRHDDYPCDQCVPAKPQEALEEISPSEALYGFAGWLTSSDMSLTIGAKHEAGEMAVLVDKFCKSQGLASPRDVYPNNLKPYPVAKPQEEPEKCCSSFNQSK